jgi:hypothetical protein
MLLFTVGAGKKPGKSGNRWTARRRRSRILNENYLLQNLKK